MKFGENRLSCRKCTRKFLTEEARQRHYNTNPNHALASLPAQTDGGYRVCDSTWVEFEDAFKTFVSLPDGATADDISVEYDPDVETIQITGDYEDTVDLNRVPAIRPNDLSWSLQTAYLVLSIPK